MKKYNNVRGFNKNKMTGHVSYVYYQKYDKCKSLGFTHNKYDRAKKQKLNYNIDPNSNDNCYVKTEVEYYNSNKYRKTPEYSKYRIHSSDIPLIKNIIKSNKKRR